MSIQRIPRNEDGRARASIAMLCTDCENPTWIGHRLGFGRTLCPACFHTQEALRSEVHTSRHDELRERIRRQRVLGRELPGRRECYPDSYPVPDLSELGEFEWEVGHVDA